MSFKFDQMCRTCLSSSEVLFSIFDKNIPEMNSTAYAVDFLKNFCKIVISPSNDLPDKVCGICAEEIKRAYAFKIKCERAADTLKKYLDQRTALQTPALIFTNAHGAEQLIIGSTITPILRAGEKITSINYEDCLVPVKRLKKKVTAKRPQAETNGSSVPADRKKVTEKRPQPETNGSLLPADIICIDDDENVKKKPFCSSDGPVISKTCSLKQPAVESNEAVTNNIAPISNTIPSPKSSTSSVQIEGPISSGDESPVSVLLIDEEDYFSESSVHEGNRDSIIPSLEINSNDVKISDKPAVSSLLLNNSESKETLNTTVKITNVDQYICHICSDVISGDENFIYHISKHKFGSENDLYEPPPLIMFNKASEGEKIAEKEVETIDITERELRVCIEDSFVCHICSKAVKGNDKFIRHVQAHTLEKEKDPSETKITAVKCGDGFKCGECGEICDTKRTLILHVRRRHMSTHTCNICTQEFQSFRELYIHRRVHFSENECGLCKRKFPTDHRLKIHKKLSHNKVESTNDELQNIFAAFNCGMCSRSFQTDDELNKHMQTHDNELE